MDLAASAPAPLHAGIVTTRFVATCEFYAEHFGFSPVEITAEFALLGRKDGSRLAVLQAGGEGQPAALSSATQGHGTWLAFETDDPDALHERLAAHGVEIVADPEDTLSGARRCVARDPNGVLIYITRSPGAPAHHSLTSIQATQRHDHHDKHLHQDHRHRLRRLPCH